MDPVNDCQVPQVLGAIISFHRGAEQILLYLCKNSQLHFFFNMYNSELPVNESLCFGYVHSFRYSTVNLSFSDFK